MLRIKKAIPLSGYTLQLTLTDGSVVERDVGLALESVLDVPDRLPVPPQHEPLGGAQLWMPFAASAASGSAISGQSFQIRSRA